MSARREFSPWLRFLLELTMYLCYLDESGQHGGKYFVLAGVSVFERQTYWLTTELDRIQERFLPDLKEPVEFHAASIRGGKEPPWNTLSEEQRHNLLDSVYGAIREGDLHLFGAAIEREWLRGEDEYDFAFEDLVSRFDRFLRWKYKEEGEAQRGLIIIAQSQYQQRVETLARRIRETGTRWGETRNLADIPLFTLAANSRLLQIADFCANAIWGRYESGFARQFDTISPKFFQANGILHGLFHFCREHHSCTCPACLSRRLRPPEAEMTLEI